MFSSFTRLLGTIVFLLVIIPLSHGITNEYTGEGDDVSQNPDRKCAQNAVFAVSKLLGHDVDWYMIDKELEGGQGFVSFAHIRRFFERRGTYCSSVRFQKSSLKQIDYFLVSPKLTCAIGVVQSTDLTDKHYVLIHKIDQDVIHLIDPI
ncbi:MAG: hypothetical protein ACRC46_04890 [Thermoguttaceae bacterium]